MPKISKVYVPSDEEFIKIIEEANSFSDCLRQLDLTTNGGNSRKVLDRRIRELNCDTSHFGRTKTGTSLNARYDMEKILIKDSPYQNRARLKIRLIKENYLEYKCEKCGISKWNNEEISLQLDHKNGVNNDNRIENLRFLCPNCHSQTSTYAGKNK